MSATPMLGIREASGSPLFERDCGRFVVVASRLVPGESNEHLHGHDYAYFSWVMRGASRECFGDGQPERRPAPGTPYFHPLGELHTAHILAPSTVMAVRLSPGFHDEIRTAHGPLERPGAVDGGAAREIGRSIFTEAPGRDGASALALEGLVHELLAAKLRQRPAHEDASAARWPDRVLEMLHARWDEPLDLDRIAREVGRHPAHVARVFRSRFGQSVGQKLRAIRLDRARRLLLAGDDTIARVGIDCGFYDESHFARLFRVRFGTSPARFRREHRGR